MMLGGNLIGRQIQRHGVSAAHDTPNSRLRARTRWITARHSTFDGFFDAKHPQQEAQMVRVELDTVIARPIDDVFGRLTHLSEYSCWMPKLGVFIRSNQTSQGPVGVGTPRFTCGVVTLARERLVDGHHPSPPVWLWDKSSPRSATSETSRPASKAQNADVMPPTANGVAATTKAAVAPRRRRPASPLTSAS